MAFEMYDHNGNPVEHKIVRTNGIRMHVCIAGEGELLLLLHGTPKTNACWCKLFPLLTEHFTVIAPDLRGFGYTTKPGATEGYDNLTMDDDLVGMLDALGYDRIHIHGEDRGAEYGWVFCMRHPERVIDMSYGEMAISGYGIEEASYFTEENVYAQYNKTGMWLWHVPFFFVQNIPEMLLEGHECQFWDALLKMSGANPNAISDDLMAEWNDRFTAPGGMRGILETYRAELKNIHINQDLIAKNGKCKTRVMTIGGIEFYGVRVKPYAERIFEKVEKSIVLENSGHHIELEQPEEVAAAITEFMLQK